MAGQVNKLDTKHFRSTTEAFKNHVKTFENIVKEVNATTKTMNDRWKGEGKKAFEKDCTQVQMNLKDFTDIFYDIAKALTNACEEYERADLELSKSFDA